MDGTNFYDARSANGHYNEAFDASGEISTIQDPESGENQNVEDGEEEAIIYTKVEKLEPRDFVSEIRPQLDIHHYFDSIQVVLDANANNPNEIVEQLVEKLFSTDKKSQILETIEEVLYTDPEKTIFSEVIQGVGTQESQGGTPVSLEPTWFIALCKVPVVKRRFIGIARTREPINFGPLVSAIKFFVLIVAPTTEKETKSASETGKTVATLLADPDVRLRLTLADTEERFRNELKSSAINRANEVIHHERIDDVNWAFGTLLVENLKRRSMYYWSDIVDGVADTKSFLKTLSTTFFLYFSVILPCIAFGVLNKKNTGNNINESRALLGQVIGGLAWAFFAGQPMLIIATTALVALYSKVVYEISINLEEDFFTVYAWVGLWNTFFILLYSVFGVSNLIRFSSRSPEEIFTIFITTCFAVDAISSLVSTFQVCYRPKVNITLAANETSFEELDFHLVCDRSSCLLSLILVIGTVWLAVAIFKFRDSPFLTTTIRELISDYALPLSVILFSFIGVYCFQKVNIETLAEFESKLELKPARLATKGSVIGTSAALGFALSILLFMDENITAQIINAPTNRMKKGGAAHLDILMIGVINCVLSIYGLPWMHAVLPHSPLHVQCMADIEDRVSDGHVYKVIVKVRETRITGILCHVLIGVTLFYPPLFSYVPVSVLDGLFLYCAVASLRGSSLYERLKLLITEQSQYPPIHYVRKCPQREMHTFTLLEMIQLAVLAFVGFAPWPYLQMTFPAFIAILIPVRYFIMPYFVNEKYVSALEEFH